MPVSAILVGELTALLITDTAPDVVPATVGAKRTLNVEDCPGARERGKASPLTEKAAPVTLTCETLRPALPVLVSATTWVLPLPPSGTLPKLMLEGLALSCPAFWAGCEGLPDPLAPKAQLLSETPESRVRMASTKFAPRGGLSRRELSEARWSDASLKG